jgi:aromatic-L-amino-acid decarboxylase
MSGMPSVHTYATTPSPNAWAAEHKRLGAAVTKMIADYVATLEARPVCSTATPDDLVARFSGPLPDNGSDSIDVLQSLQRDVLPDLMNIASPRYFGLFNPAPLPLTVWVDALCSAVNQNAAGWRNSPSASAMESCVIRWLCELFGLPASSFGTLSSGGSEANLIALKCARDRAVTEASEYGLADSRAALRVYASEQCHYSVAKSADIVGIGRRNVRLIDTDDRFRIRIDALRATIDADLAAGYQPCCVIGIAGTTSAGAVDPLSALADLAAELRLWFHVDAAYGGALAFSETHRSQLDGIDRADSITFDAHKWMSVPFSCGAVLTRLGASVLRDAFDSTPAYLSENRYDTIGDDGSLDFFRYGQLGTRRANAMKLWAALRRLGRRGYEQLVDSQIALTKQLANQLATDDDFELIGDVQTAVCCVRYIPPAARRMTAIQQDELQCAVQQRIEYSGRAWLATTVLHGRRALRINVNSLLTHREHLDDLAAQLRHEGARLVAKEA